VFRQYVVRMKTDVPTKFITPLLGWLIGECRRFCDKTGRTHLSQDEQEILIQAFENLDWKSVGKFGRNRYSLLAAIRDTLGGELVTPLPGRTYLDSSPRDGPIPQDIGLFARRKCFFLGLTE